MNPNLKSLVLLSGTLIVGFALGLFADATLVRARRGRLGELRRPPGFVAHLESVIQPHSDEQRDSIATVLERAAHQNQQALRETDARLRSVLDSMRVAIDPMLDAAQRDRLAVELQRMATPFGRGGRGRGGAAGPGGGPPGFDPGVRRGGPPPP